jgi:hypothetical protein
MVSPKIIINVAMSAGSMLTNIKSWVTKTKASFPMAARVFTILSTSYQSYNVYRGIKRNMEELDFTQDKCDLKESIGKSIAKDEIALNFSEWWKDEIVQEFFGQTTIVGYLSDFLALADVSSDALDYYCKNIRSKKSTDIEKRNTIQDVDEIHKVASIIQFTTDSEFEISFDQLRQFINTSLIKAIESSSDKKYSFKDKKTDFDHWFGKVFVFWNSQEKVHPDAITNLHQVFVAQLKRLGLSDTFILSVSYFFKQELEQIDPNATLEQTNIDDIRRTFFLFNSMTNDVLKRIKENDS